MSLDLGWFEPKNERRGGWSGVSKIELPTADGASRFFVKRQANHSYRSIRSFFLKAPTLRREFLAITSLQKAGVAVPEVCFYAEDKDLNSILITRSLDDYKDLAQYLTENPANEERDRIIRGVVDQLLKFHQTAYSHGSLYAKHIMVTHRTDLPTAVLIDLEKARKNWPGMAGCERDISQLLRYSGGLAEEEKNYLIDSYCALFPGFKEKLEKLLQRKTRSPA